MNRRVRPTVMRQVAIRSLMTPVMLELARVLQRAAFATVEPNHVFEDGFEPAPLYNAQALALYTNIDLLEKTTASLLMMTTALIEEHENGNRT